MRETGQWRWQVWSCGKSDPFKKPIWYLQKTYRADDYEAADNLALSLIREGMDVKIVDKNTGKEVSDAHDDGE
jgi:hypothetical protein